MNKIKHRSIEESEDKNGDTEDSEQKTEVVMHDLWSPRHHNTADVFQIPTEFTTSSSLLLQLPAEIRNIIYDLVLARTPKESGSHNSPFWIPKVNIRIYQGVFSFPIPSRLKFINDLALLRTSRQVYWEVRPLLYKMELRGSIDITIFQPRIVKTRGYALEPYVRHSAGIHRLIEPGRKSTDKEKPGGSYSLVKEKDCSCQEHLSRPIEPNPERLWNYTCTYCKNHLCKFYTPYPGCDCPRSPRLIRTPPLALVATAKKVIIRILRSLNGEQEEPGEGIL